MSRPTILFVFFLIQFLSQSLGLWDVVITRDGQDSFRLVDKNDLSCYRTNNEYCTMKNGKLDSNAKTCQCVCPSNASTFAFVTGNWRCINDIRRKSSCPVAFKGENLTNSPLKVVMGNSYYKFLAPSPTCRILYSESHYRSCNGSWLFIGPQRPFYLFPFGESDVDSKRYKISMSVAKIDALSGHIVKLQLQCFTPSFSSCLIFKANGSQRCPVEISIPPTSKSTNLALLTMKTQRSTLASTYSQKTTTEPLTTEIISSSQGNTLMIVSMVVGISAAIVVVVVMVIIIRKRKRAYRSSSRDELQPRPPAEPPLAKPSTSNITTEGLIYDYAVPERQNKWARRWFSRKVLQTSKEKKSTYLNKHRTSDAAYETPFNESNASLQNQRNPNEGYETSGQIQTQRPASAEYETLFHERPAPNHSIPNDEYELPFKACVSYPEKHRDPNEGYEIPMEVRKTYPEKHRIPNSASNTIRDKNSSKSRPPTLPKVDYPQSNADQDYHYAVMEDSRVTRDSTLKDSDGYVSMY